MRQFVKVKQNSETEAQQHFRNSAVHTEVPKRRHQPSAYTKSADGTSVIGTTPLKARMRALDVPHDGTQVSINKVVQRVVAGGQHPVQRHEDYMYLQRTAGNRTVVQLMKALKQSGDDSTVPRIKKIDYRPWGSFKLGSAIPRATEVRGVGPLTDNKAVQLGDELDTETLTPGREICLDEGNYSPSSTDNKHFPAPEMIDTVRQSRHLVQQSEIIQPSSQKIIQRDLAASMPSSHGVFDVNMRTREDLLLPGPPAGAKSGLSGTIKFEPSPTAPYSNQIKLIQIIRDINTKTNTPVRIGTMPPGGRQDALSTNEDATTGVEGDFHTDVLHHNPSTGVSAPPGSQVPLDYPFGPTGSPGGAQILGYKRSANPADIKAAEMFDFPGTFSLANDRDFSFETVAKGEDTLTVYGSLAWDFSIRSGAITAESMSVQDDTSATFESAVELHRDFYVHEPVSFYFGFDQDTMAPAEIAKIDSFLDYLSRFPDVHLKLEGFTDIRGNAAYNSGLANRRTNAAAQALIDKGIDPLRIQKLPPHGITTQFTTDATTSQEEEANRRGNRRVTVTFEHTMSFPGPP